ncbi:MAG: CDP-alcohol phosphatidyltransferase family protein [Pseudomonadota bacterium]|nr:CDP-alcohol phosphatidyltransferase family protein [Pseudomonadota bacterium]
MLFLLPNLLSFLRVILAVIISIYAQYPDTALLCLYLMFCAAISDIGDGALARFLRVESDFGRMFDPTCDAFFLVCLLSSMAYANLVSLPLFTAIVLRYVILMVLHGHLYMSGYRNIGSLWLGKCCAFSCFLFLAMTFASLQWPAVVSANFLYYIEMLVWALLFLSFSDYINRYILVLRS